MPRKKTGYRRGNKEGSIYQRKDGLWTGVATFGYDENGKLRRKVVYSKSKLEAIRKLSEITNRMTTETYTDINATLSKIMFDWLMVFKKAQVTPRTFEGNISKFKLHIESQIGGMKLEELTPMVLQKFFNNMQDKGLSLDYVKKTRYLLRQFFEYAVDNNLIKSNPISKVKIQARERKRIVDEFGINDYKAVPQEARSKLMIVLNEHEFLKPLCYTMIYGGLRIGETLALKWGDVDFKNDTLKILRGATYEPKFDEQGNVEKRIKIISNTKTVCSERIIPITKALSDILKEYKRKRTILGKNLNKDLTNNQSLIFGNDDGTLRTYSGTKSIFVRFLEKHDLKKYKIHLHSLRHTFSNMLFEAQQNPKLVQALLGHKDVRTTLSTYNSIDKTYFDKATEVLNDNYDEFINKEKQTMYDNLDDEQIEELLTNLQQQKEKRKKEKDFEM